MKENPKREELTGRRDEEEFPEVIEEKSTRRQRAKGKRDSVWVGLGTFGMIGWSIGIPAVLGALLGAWIDFRWPGPIPWTLVFLLTGLVMGSLGAWRWISREMEDIRRDREK